MWYWRWRERGNRLAVMFELVMVRLDERARRLYLGPGALAVELAGNWPRWQQRRPAVVVKTASATATSSRRSCQGSSSGTTLSWPAPGRRNVVPLLL